MATPLLITLSDDPQFTQLVDGLLAEPEGPAVILDLLAVRYINSSNLSKLLRLRKQMVQSERALTLCSMGPQVRGVFEATGLDKVFTIAADLAEAQERSAG